MKKLLLIIFICSPYLSFPQMINEHLADSMRFGAVETGLISDPDGYTNIRNGKGAKFEIVDKLDEGEFFHFVPKEEESWWIVHKLWNKYGYVHKSRIRNIEDLKLEEKKTLLYEIFEKEKVLAEKSDDSKDDSNKWVEFHETKFDEVMDIFSGYICQTKDNVLLDKFLRILLIESGSADEAPLWALGKIYLCHPDWTISQIKPFGASTLEDGLYFGFENVTYKRESEISNYKELKEKLEKL